VDIIDSLIDEWFPGLLEASPLGHWLLRHRAPCIQCPRENPHIFNLDELVKWSETSNEIRCPHHEDTVPLALLAPDVVLGDLEREFIIEQRDLILHEWYPV
jgi:hypothetical protein